MNKKITPEAKRFLHIIIYGLFIYYTWTFIQQAPSTETKLFYALLALTSLVVTCLSEYLSYLSDKAIKTLNYKCNPEEAKTIYDQLQKLDFFKSYKKRRILFDLLYHLALLNSNQAIALIENHDKFFRSSLDALFIRDTSLFIAYIQSDQKGKAKRIYPDILRLKDRKVKGKKLSSLYHWDELEALYQYISNHPDKACQIYQDINMSYMNNKEKSQVFFFYYQSLLKLNRIQEANDTLHKLQAVQGKLPFDKYKVNAYEG